MWAPSCSAVRGQASACGEPKDPVGLTCAWLDDSPEADAAIGTCEKLMRGAAISASGGRGTRASGEQTTPRSPGGTAAEGREGRYRPKRGNVFLLQVVGGLRLSEEGENELSCENYCTNLFGLPSVLVWGGELGGASGISAVRSISAAGGRRR